MKSGKSNPGKELYNELRRLSCEQLWEDEVPRFNRATPQERIGRVALIRAVGVVFSESGTETQKNEARQWLRGLLHDPCEKTRRYAMTAMPKIGAGPAEEAELLSLVRTTGSELEKKFLGRALDKIGGSATLNEMEQGGFLLQTEQKVRASIARNQSPSAVRMESVLSGFAGLCIHLRGRRGLEQFVRAELEEAGRTRGKFRATDIQSGIVKITPSAPFTLGDIYSLRCFGTVGFVLGNVSGSDDGKSIDALASVITSPMSRHILETFTEGSIRYRLDFVSMGHQRGTVRLLANRAYAMCPAILNDARNAPWTVSIHPAKRGSSVELTPRLTPDPRFSYRQQDVPAASHPPLAACMARLAERMPHEVVWDPFCGSGLELIERALLGGVRSIYGTDRSAEAIAITARNFAAAKVKSVQSKFICCDFRDYGRINGLGPSAVSLIITNPPMGKRVPIPNLRGLIGDLFSVAATVLQPGGRLVFANPLRMECPQRSLKLQSRQVVDFGGFDCRLEMYLKR